MLTLKARALHSVLLLAVLVATGCSNIAERQRGDELTDSLRTYAKLLRWGLYEDASQYLRHPDDEAITVDLARYEGVKITSYNNVTEGMADSGLESRVVTVIAYYRQDTGVLREIRYEQVWWYDEESGRWFLNGTLPDFR